MKVTSKQVTSSRLLVVVLALLVLPLFGWGCSKEVPPSAPPASPASKQEEQAKTPEQAFVNFKAALERGDYNAALEQVHPAGQKKIGGYFNLMQKNNTLQAFVHMLGEMRPVKVGDEIAEFDIMEPGDKEPLTMTFMKVNGVWKVRDF